MGRWSTDTQLPFLQHDFRSSDLAGHPAGRRAVMTAFRDRRTGAAVKIRVAVLGPGTKIGTFRFYEPRDFDEAYDFWAGLGGRPGPGMTEVEFAAWWAGRRLRNAIGQGVVAGAR